jgi:hypothetical protein
VLFSAHFDSASTAPGASDNDVSVVALMRVIVFCPKAARGGQQYNIDNGEVDGHHGA